MIDFLLDDPRGHALLDGVMAGLMVVGILRSAGDTVACVGFGVLLGIVVWWLRGDLREAGL